MRYFILILLMIGFVSAVSVDFDCPNSVEVDEEFECSLEVFDGNGIYDVKVEIRDGEDDVAEIWNEEKDDWQSTYYYLQDFIGEGTGEIVELKVDEVGDFKGILKLRLGDVREFFEFKIEVVGDESGEKAEEIVVDDYEEIVLLEKPQEIISLNDNVDSELVYESKDSKIMNYLPYVFSGFLIVILGILIWERF